jgi:hypothetical protein
MPLLKNVNRFSDIGKLFEDIPEEMGLRFSGKAFI